MQGTMDAWNEMVKRWILVLADAMVDVVHVVHEVCCT